MGAPAGARERREGAGPVEGRPRLRGEDRASTAPGQEQRLARATRHDPRHIIISSDNRFAYLLNELTAEVTTLALDAGSGQLKPVGTAKAVPPDSKLVPGMPRGAVGTPGANQAPRNTDNDVWASDLHLTPDGRFLYAAERTNASITGFSVDGATGKLTYVSSTPTEKQPRGFAIDPSGRFMVVSGELSQTLSSYAIGADGGLRHIGSYAGGKGANWVEIVD